MLNKVSSLNEQELTKQKKHKTSNNFEFKILASLCFNIYIHRKRKEKKRNLKNIIITTTDFTFMDLNFESIPSYTLKC